MARQDLAKILAIERIPASVRDIKCVHYGVTDQLTRCAFRFEPQDAAPLLAGCPFNEARERVGRTIHDDAHPKVGPNFVVATAHLCMLAPDEAPRGGILHFSVDRTQTFGTVDLYIE